MTEYEDDKEIFILFIGVLALIGIAALTAWTITGASNYHEHIIEISSRV